MASPRGWLDIHGHFSLPLSEKELEKQLASFHAIDFLASELRSWSAEDVLPYLDRANVTMQMLSCIPKTLDVLRKTNDYGAGIVSKYPSRFGLLLALPTDNVVACLDEIKRGDMFDVPNDGYALNTIYNGVMLSSETLEPLLQELDARKAVCHVHPDAFKKGSDGRPSPLIDVAFETARTITDMLYKGRWCSPSSVRAYLIAWDRVMGPQPAELDEEGNRGVVGVSVCRHAASAKTGMYPAAQMVGIKHIVYGADCGVPCSTEATMTENQKDVMDIERLFVGHAGTVGQNGWNLFPAASARAGRAQNPV